ncbi:MAG TPA: SlyX family protein [Steroidobacteraceae bacterium]|nr:SlyX family protein [Steroidobacteraceae bacterium]
MEDRLEQLETKVAFLEQANSELSDELFRRRQEIEALREQFAALRGRLDAAQAQPAAPYSPEDEKPPHY